LVKPDTLLRWQRRHRDSSGGFDKPIPTGQSLR
jgi:hypothetical protein